MKNTMLRLRMMPLLLGLSIQLTPNIAFAQYFTGPAVNALGGAGAAARGSSINMTVNPASLAIMQTIEFDGQYRNGDLGGERNESFYGVSVGDNTKDVLIAGGLTYLRGNRKASGLETDDQYWNVSFAKRVSEHLALGGSVVFLDTQVKDLETFKQYNGTLGGMIIVNESLVFCLVYHSFVTPDEDVPLAFRLTPTSRLGVRWTPEDFFSLRMDVSRREHENPEGDGSIHLGLESMVNDFNIIRVGSRIDDYAKQNYASVGWGFNGPKLKLNYSFEKPLRESNGAMHSVDMLIGF